VSKIGPTDIRKLLIVGALSRIRWIIEKGVMPELARTAWRVQISHSLGRRPGEQDGRII
jgi:hypothetical protein